MTSEAPKYVIVDTDVFSYLLRRQNADVYQPHLTGVVPVLSFASVAELYSGAAQANWGEGRRRDLAEATAGWAGLLTRLGTPWRPCPSMLLRNAAADSAWPPVS